MKKLLLVIPLVFLTLAACGTVSNMFVQPSATPAPTPTPDKGATLSRVVWSIGNEIYITQGASGKLTKVTSFPSLPFTENPQLSPDGKQIVFEAGASARLYVVNVDGSNLKKVTPDTYSAKYPSWSADGKSIVFIAMKSLTPGQVNMVLSILNLERSEVNEIYTTNKAIIDPVLSPDGQSIAFSSGEVYVMSIKGENMRKVSDSGNGLNADVAWSPDGKQILFRTNPNTILGGAGTPNVETGGYDLYVVSPDGSGQKRLTSDADSKSEAYWSPDGRMIVYKNRPDSKNRFNYVQVMAIYTDGSGRTMLAEVDTSLYRPTATPTPIPIPSATPRVKLLDTPIKATLTFLSGPVDGSLTHDEKYISTNCINKKVKDFMAEAVVYNPYSTGKGQYDFGFLFRQAGQDQGYRLSITSGGSWRLTNRADSTSMDISSGSLRVNTGEKDVNRIKLIAAGNTGYFYLNDLLITTLNLGARGDVGEVCVAAGITSGYKRAGETTRFEDFNVWSLSMP